MMTLWYNRGNKKSHRALAVPVAWPNLVERFDMSILPRFYVYILARPDGTPFYIGKGSGRRVFDHDTEARSGCKCHKCNVIRKIWRNGGEVQRYTVFTTDSEQEAYAHEAELIDLHGRANLANGTDGGIGGHGRIVPPEERELHRANTAARLADPAVRAQLSASRVKDWERPEYRKNLSEQSRARWADPDQRDKMLSAIRPAQRSEESRAMKRAAQDRRWSSSGARDQNSAQWKARWADPEYRGRRTFERACAQCDEVFQAITVTAKFCSERCKHRFYRKAKS